MLKVKVCGNKFEENAIQIAELKPDFMGFIFYKESKRYCAEISIATILSLKRNNTIPVAVFVNEKIETVLEICSLYQISHIQLHGTESVEYCKVLKNLGFTIIKAIPVEITQKPGSAGNRPDGVSHELAELAKEIEKYQNFVDYLLFDTKTEQFGGSGKKFNHELLKDISIEKPFFLSGGISVEDAKVLANLQIENLYCIDINSKFETEAGVKNIETLAQFISKIRNKYEL